MRTRREIAYTRLMGPSLRGRGPTGLATPCNAYCNAMGSGTETGFWRKNGGAA